MIKPQISGNERERLLELNSFYLQDLPEKEDYDFLTSMASKICNTKISLINIISEDYQWSLSHHGIEVNEVPRELSFCAHAINEPEVPFIVEDATKDERFFDNPFTTGSPNVTFYAGIPLVSSNGFALGTLCVIDDKAKKLENHQIEELKKLGSLCVKLFEGRKKNFDKDKLVTEIIEKNELLEETQKVNKLGIWELDIATGDTLWSDTVYEIHELSKKMNLNKVKGIEFYHPHYRELISDVVEKCISDGTPFNVECILITAKNNKKWVKATGRKVGNKLVGSFQDISKIKSNEQKINSILEGTNVGTWEWNVQTGQTVFNERWAEIVGYTLEELEPINIETWLKLAHPDDLIDSGKKLNDCFEKKAEYYECEARMRHKNGHWVWVYDRGKVFEWTEDGKPLMMYGTHQDISIQKNREAEITYRKQLFKALYELSPIGIALNDYDTGTFIDVNDKLLEPSGYTKEEFLKLNYWQITPKEYEPFEIQALKQMEKNGSYDLFEKEYVSKHGYRYPVAVQGVVIKDVHGKKLIWSIVRDISKEKEAERNLKDAISSLNSVFDASEQVSIIATDLDGIITKFNSGAEKLLGYKAKEIIGKQSPELIHDIKEIETQSKFLSKKYNKEIIGFETFVYEAKMGFPSTKEWTYKRKDQSTFPVLLSVNTIKHENEIIGFLGVATDISELKKVELEIKSLLDITKEQNERLQNFAHIVSHNLRSYSGGIYGMLELIPMEHPELKDSELLNLLNRGAENLKETVNDLTQIVKINLVQSDYTDINLHNVINKNKEILSLEINKNKLDVFNNIDLDLKFKAIPAYIDSIILNMITNAIKYKSLDRNSYLNIYNKIEDSMLCIYFEDNGLGIDLKKFGEKIFGLYKKFHYHDDSRGVGLFITKNQIESMGGKIEVFSEVNVGTTFKITLPL